MKSVDPVVVVGAGLAGLTAASYLREHDVEVIVFEASKSIAGLARSEFDSEGFSCDCGAHFINSRLAAALGISASCKAMPTYEEAFWHKGKRYRYPFGLLTSPRFVASAGLAQLRRVVSNGCSNLTDEFRLRMGRAVADDIALPLVAAWSGAEGVDLSPAVAQKLTTGLWQTAMLRISAHLSGRNVAVGYSHEVRESPHVTFVYPDGGIGAVCERVAEKIRDSIRTESPVQAINVADNRVVSVVVNDQEIRTSAVVSTAPLPILARLVQGTDRLKQLSEFRYRPMVFVNLKFAGSEIMSDVVTWTPECKYPFFRISDIGRALPWIVPEGKNQLTCDIGCNVGDDVWIASPEQLAKSCLDRLEEIVPGLSSRYLGVRIMSHASRLSDLFDFIRIRAPAT